MTFRTVVNQTTLESVNPGTLGLVEGHKRSMVNPVIPETADNFAINDTAHRAADYQSALINPAATPTDAFSGAPGGFIPILSNFADLSTVQGSGVVPSDADWDTKGDYLVLGDDSEAHYRLGSWTAGRVP